MAEQPMIDQLAVQSATMNQYIETYLTEKNKSGIDEKKTQQPIGYFSQCCFTAITSHVMSNLPTYIDDFGNLKENELQRTSEQITEIFFILWTTMVKKRIRQSYKKVKKEPEEVKKEQSAVLEKPSEITHEEKVRKLFSSPLNFK